MTSPSLVFALLASQGLADEVRFEARHVVREWPLTAAYQECALRRIPYLRSVMRLTEEDAAVRSLLECSPERELERRAVIRDQLPEDRRNDADLVERIALMCNSESNDDELTGLLACAATNQRLRLADNRVIQAARARYRELAQIEQERNAGN